MKMFNLKEAALELGYSARSVYTWAQEGRIKALKPVKNQVFDEGSNKWLDVPERFKTQRHVRLVLNKELERFKIELSTLKQ